MDEKVAESMYSPQAVPAGAGLGLEGVFFNRLEKDPRSRRVFRRGPWVSRIPRARRVGRKRSLILGLISRICRCASRLTGGIRYSWPSGWYRLGRTRSSDLQIANVVGSQPQIRVDQPSMAELEASWLCRSRSAQSAFRPVSV